MSKSAKGTIEQHGKQVAQKAGLNRRILAVGWHIIQLFTESARKALYFSAGI